LTSRINGARVKRLRTSPNLHGRHSGREVDVKCAFIVICFAIDFARVALFVMDMAAATWVCSLRTVPVIVATRDLPEGIAIDSAAVTVAHWVQGTQPFRAYASVDAVVGRVSGRAIRQGEALAPDRLIP
jgi:Flp pilus assembly protein CpaB